MVRRDLEYGEGVEIPLPDGEDFLSFCEKLYEEGRVYDTLPSEEVIKFGTHTSIVLHPYRDGSGRWASIHYRENLGQIAEIEGQAAKAKAFLEI